jgi:23S rRNA (cytidine1920-2'-O)/16S rRNA (cytidine1409-2'-O)-methyltransferase
MSQYVSRGGDKLAAALDRVGMPVTDLTVADLGSSTGGFVDVLLQRGARKVYAVEVGFGVLDWHLRNDSRVEVMERTDARTVQIPMQVDLMTADVGFTKQSDFLPHALGFVKPGGHILSLVKPQYEASGRELVKGRLNDDVVRRVLDRVSTAVKNLDVTLLDLFPSALTGKDAKVQEYFMLLRRLSEPSHPR